jgi:hypothetical protein
MYKSHCSNLLTSNLLIKKVNNLQMECLPAKNRKFALENWDLNHF